LFEPGELVRPSVACVSTIQGADLGGTVNGASRRARPLLGPFPERKGPRLPGRNQAIPSAKVKLQHTAEKKNVRRTKLATTDLTSISGNGGALYINDSAKILINI